MKADKTDDSNETQFKLFMSVNVLATVSRCSKYLERFVRWIKNQTTALKSRDTLLCEQALFCFITHWSFILFFFSYVGALSYA